MRIRARTWKNSLCFIVCAAGLTCSSPAQLSVPPPQSGGIGQAADNMAAQALDLLNNGKLKEAADAYAALLKKYPNSGDVPEALFRLGYIQYVQGNYQDAVTTLQRITLPADIKAAADALIPQILAAQAAKLPPGDPKRKAAFQDAIKQFDAFITKYPDSAEVESANYGRAMAEFQNQDYAQAAQSLEANVKRFPNSESILDSKDLLAVVLTAQGSSILREHGDQQAAFHDFDEAQKDLADIISGRKDVALANDAMFQYGEVYFDRGSAEEEGPDRTKDLTNAILVYRAVQPKEMMVQAQTARVAEQELRLRQAALSRNQEQIQVMQRLLDRDNAKLQALKDAPDQTMYAQLRIAACYFQLKKFDEARVLVNYLQGFADSEDQKKQIQYYLVLTYASQGLQDKAVAAYNEFQAKYKNDPLGENLPLAMGTIFLSVSNAQPDKAIAYFKQELALYPKSSLVNDALGQEAAALVGLKRFDEALATYQKFLATNPPADQAAQADVGIGTIYQQQAELDPKLRNAKLQEAIKQYEKVATNYPGTPVAERSAFFAALIQSNVDLKLALPQLQDFVKKYPEGQFTPEAMLRIGMMHASWGQAPEAMQTYQDIIEKFPKSSYAAAAYFQQAGLLAQQKKINEMVALLQNFIKKYPDSKDIFYAYDTIAQTQVTNGQVPAAIATYTEMAENHPDNPMAATALYRTAELWRKQADAQGRYLALNETQRKDWSTNVAASIAAAEKLLEKFPESDQVGLALKTLLADQQMLLAAKQSTPEAIDKYFQTLADKFNSNLSAKNHILFTLGTFTYEKDPAKGLAQMAAAYDPSLVYAPADLDLFGAALIDQGKADQAYRIYQKIVGDFPTPPGVQPAQAQPAIQEAQATALFGMASALEKEGKTAEASTLFTQLKNTYPWSPKVVEANFGIAKSLIQQNKLDDAMKLLNAIVGSSRSPARLRAHAFVLIGDIYAAKTNIDGAIDSYLKTAAYYGGVPDAAAEGLWKGGQALEKQAGMLTEQSTPKKSEQMAKAVTAYKNLISKYTNSQYVKPAQDRLNALGAPQ